MDLLSGIDQQIAAARGHLARLEEERVQILLSVAESLPPVSSTRLCLETWRLPANGPIDGSAVPQIVSVVSTQDLAGCLWRRIAAALWCWWCATLRLATRVSDTYRGALRRLYDRGVSLGSAAREAVVLRAYLLGVGLWRVVYCTPEDPCFEDHICPKCASFRNVSGSGG